MRDRPVWGTLAGVEAWRTLSGRYRLESLLGVGGMSEVWRARDSVLGRRVAVKLLSAGRAGDTLSRRRIRAEARAAASLCHPHIAQVFDYGESSDGEPYVVMELVDGQALSARAAAGPISTRQVLRLGAEVAGALAAVHAIGLVHRDIKLANIMLTPAGAKVVDFGIAASVTAEADPLVPAGLFGTPAYLAPERLTSDAVEPASDVYSLGVVLYLLLCQRFPWPAESPTELVAAHLDTPPEPLPRLPDTPEAVRDLVHACLAKDPADRPAAHHLSVVLGAVAGSVAPALPDGPGSAGDIPTVLTLSGAVALAAVQRDATDADESLTTAAGNVAGAVTPAGNGSEPPAQKAAQAQAGAGRPAGDVPARRPTISRYRLVMLFTIVAGLVMMAWSNLPTGGRHPATAQPAASGPAADRPDALNRTGTAPAPPVPSMSGQPHDLPTSSRTPASTGTSTTLSPTGATTTTQSVPTTGSTVGTVFTSQGGTATAVCEAASQVHLTGYDPARSYSVSTADTGPAAQAQVVFRHGNTLVQMTFSCSGGMPTEVTTVR